MVKIITSRHYCLSGLTVTNRDSKFVIERVCGIGATHNSRGRHYLQCSLLAILVWLLSPGFAAATERGVQSGPAATVGPGASFAIADFDGDQRPDFASVEADRLGSSSTSYWIQLRLTGSGQQAIQLVAPPGGLQIEARDVNGDNAVDLVLSTAWFKQPVAVFLNDGHGRFSRAEPSDFPDAFSDPTRSWNSSSNSASAAAGIPPQMGSGICSGTTNLPNLRDSSKAIPSTSSEFLFDSLLIAYSGRAPPSEAPHHS